MNNKDMAKERYNFTMDKKTYFKLQALSKRHKRNMSNMIEILIDEAFDNKEKIQYIVDKRKREELQKEVKEKVDEIDWKP